MIAYSKAIIIVLAHVLCLSLVACQPLLPPLTQESVDLPTVQTDDSEAANDGQATAIPAEEPPEETPAPTTVPTEEPPEEAPAPTTTPTEEPPEETPAPTTAPTEEPPEEASAPTTAPTEEAVAEAAASPSASVLVDRLNVRSGPGVVYDIVDVANQGDVFEITGQYNNCEWLHIKTQSGESAWISGSVQYVTYTPGCTDLPVAAEPPTPIPATPQPEPQSAEPTQEAASPATPTPAAETDTNVGADPYPADQGCYLMNNHIGAELFVTVTAQDWEWVDHFTVDRMGEHVFCLGVGRYTVTIDAPPPWADINTDLKVNAGDRMLWPIWGEQ